MAAIAVLVLAAGCGANGEGGSDEVGGGPGAAGGKFSCDEVSVDELRMILNGYGVITPSDLEPTSTESSCNFHLKDVQLDTEGYIEIARYGASDREGPYFDEFAGTDFESESGVACTTYARDWADASTTRCETGSDDGNEIVVTIDYYNLDPAWGASRPAESYGRLADGEHRMIAETVTNLLLDVVE